MVECCCICGNRFKGILSQYTRLSPDSPKQLLCVTCSNHKIRLLSARENETVDASASMAYFQQYMRQQTPTKEAFAYLQEELGVCMPEEQAEPYTPAHDIVTADTMDHGPISMSGGWGRKSRKEKKTDRKQNFFMTTTAKPPSGSIDCCIGIVSAVDFVKNDAGLIRQRQNLLLVQLQETAREKGAHGIVGLVIQAVPAGHGKMMLQIYGTGVTVK